MELWTLRAARRALYTFGRMVPPHGPHARFPGSAPPEGPAEGTGAPEDPAAALKLQRLVLSVMSHDLRSPLAAISLASSRLLRADADGETRITATRIQRAAHRAIAMLDMLQDVARATMGGRIPLSVSACDLGDICEELIAELQEQADGRNVRLRVTSECTGQWDRTRLGQVVSNLLGNALAYGTPGRDVIVTCGADDDWATLSVENPGPKIASERMAGLFDPYKRGADEASGHQGLGLYIVKQLVAAHGGTVEVRSNDASTAFTVRLPRNKGG